VILKAELDEQLKPVVEIVDTGSPDPLLSERRTESQCELVAKCTFEALADRGLGSVPVVVNERSTQGGRNLVCDERPERPGFGNQFAF
jgi:hypothetical protein